MTASKLTTDFLDAKGVRYLIDHHDACFTAQELASDERVSGYRVAKTVVCLADDRPVILVLPAPYDVDLDAVARELEADEVTIVEPAAMLRLLPGTTSTIAPPPLPLWDGVRIHADASMVEEAEIIFPAGSAFDAVRMSRADWAGIAGASVGRFAISSQSGAVPSVTVVGVAFY